MSVARRASGFVIGGGLGDPVGVLWANTLWIFALALGGWLVFRRRDL